MLEELLNKHAPLKEKVVVERPTQQQWITEDILAAKRERPDVIVDTSDSKTNKQRVDLLQPLV